MVVKKFIVLLLLTPVLFGCGTYVPEIQENPLANAAERSDFIQAIVRNVRCEVQDAVVRLYADNRDIDPYNRNLKWFDSWAAQISLTLTIDEKGALNPTANILPKSPLTSVFNLGVGATVSTESQRVDKIGSFFTVAELKSRGMCDPRDRDRGPFILQSNLKLLEWLQATMVSIDNRDTPAPADSGGPLQSNVLSHEVKFDIVSTGTANPGWLLTNGTINQGGTLLSATRDRTQDLTITFGPPDPKWAEFIDPVTRRRAARPRALGQAAGNAALASDIGTAIGNAVRNGLRP
jgi:hypothetical protein